MKIGILTFPPHVNYGGIIQAYALQTELERMGHEVVVFNKHKTFSHPLSFFWLKIYAKRLAHKIVKNHRAKVFTPKRRRREWPIISQHTQRFIDTYIKSLYVEDLRKIGPDCCDAIVVGSDQIWRAAYCHDWTENFADLFLEFTRGWNLRRVAYAASFGTDEWETGDWMRRRCARAVGMFNAVSVREDSGVAMCRDYLGVDAVHVLDPTMLLSPGDYARLYETAHTEKSSGSLCYYMLDNNEAKRALVDRMAKERGLEPFTVMPLRGQRPVEERVYPPVEKWLRGFADAAMVLTDSFHGCVFSILFGKPFVAVGNTGRGLARMQSLLHTFGLEDHLILSTAGYDAGKSYALSEEVGVRLDELREEARAFLRSALEM